MICKSWEMIRDDFDTIDKLAKETLEPIYIMKDDEVSGVYMALEVYERREQELKLREELLLAEEKRVAGGKMFTLDELKQELMDESDEE